MNYALWIIVAHRFPQIFTDLYSQTGRLLCIMNYALWIIVAHRFSLIFTDFLFNDNANNINNFLEFIFENLWKFTGISVKYKTQIGTNDHILSKILLLKPVGPSKRVENWELRTERYDYLWCCPNSQTPINSSKFKVQSSRFKVQSSKTLPSLPYEGRSRAGAGSRFQVQVLPTDSHRFKRFFWTVYDPFRSVISVRSVWTTTQIGTNVHKLF